MTAVEVTVEYRMIVEGWKDDGYTGKKHQEFSSVHHGPVASSVASEMARIGEEGLPDWQPHITAVRVERREVTEWEEVDPAVLEEDLAPRVDVCEGWWHPNTKGGQVHDHPERPGRNWSPTMHRQCERVYTKRGGS